MINRSKDRRAAQRRRSRLANKAGVPYMPYADAMEIAAEYKKLSPQEKLAHAKHAVLTGLSILPLGFSRYV